MSKLNLPARAQRVFTHEGAATSKATPQQQLRRSVLSCLLWEDNFYEDGESIAERITNTAALCSTEYVAALAKEARNEYKLRHVPLLLCMDLVKRGGKIVGETITDVIQRPDELTEIVAMYWKDGRRPLSKQLKIGIANAFAKFDEYQFAKYNRKGAVKLRDVMFMVRPKPRDDQQIELYRRIAENELAVPETWEVQLSGGGDKKTVFTDLLQRNKLGYMALLRNLRNMVDAGVDRALIEEKLLSGAAKSKALPFRYLSAAIAAPSLEPALDEAMLAAFEGLPKFAGSTVVLVDVSGSMGSTISDKSMLRRYDAASGLAIYAREASDNCRLFMFGTECQEVPARRGMALRDILAKGGTVVGHATDVYKAIATVNKAVESYDRIIVITDEQSRESAAVRPKGHGYILNVAPYQNGIGYGQYTHIDGWSDQSIRYIQEMEPS